MKVFSTILRKVSVLLLLGGSALAQVPNPTQMGGTAPPPEAVYPTPVFRVTVVARTITAVNYNHREGTTEIDFRGTELMPEAKGHASIESRMGSTKISTDLKHLPPANAFGPEFLTYVLWAITPQGRAQNLGELAVEGDHSKLLSTTELQAFGLMVTAEPYFAVTQPSDAVVMENVVREDTTGTIEQVDAKYELLKRGSYTMGRSGYVPVRIDPKGPLQLAEAQNAVQLARLVGADNYAPDTFQKATMDLQNAQGFAFGNHDRKAEETAAREATQMAEDSRIITLKKIDEEHLAQERAAAAQREASAQAEAQAEAQRRAQAEAAQAAAQQAAQQQQQLAQLEAEKAQMATEEANRARQQALEDANQARQQAADQLNQARQQAEAEKAELRTQLKQQLNMILQTRDTARGLIVNMSDVLFDTARYTLRPGAREKLAKVAGIVVSHPGLNLSVEGHTDSVGSDEYNQVLSEERAQSVRDYLVAQGVPAATVTAKGLGKTMPVASNDTAEGRQQNRRVELVVSGDIIGAEVSRLR